MELTNTTDAEVLAVLQLWRDQSKRVLVPELHEGFLGPLLKELKIQYTGIEDYLKAAHYDVVYNEPQANERLTNVRRIRGKLHAFERVLNMLDSNSLRSNGVLSGWFATNQERFTKLHVYYRYGTYVSDDAAFRGLIGELLACLTKEDKDEAEQ